MADVQQMAERLRAGFRDPAMTQAAFWGVVSDVSVACDAEDWGKVLAHLGVLDFDARRHVLTMKWDRDDAQALRQHAEAVGDTPEPWTVRVIPDGESGCAYQIVGAIRDMKNVTREDFEARHEANRQAIERVPQMVAALLRIAEAAEARADEQYGPLLQEVLAEVGQWAREALKEESDADTG